MSQTSGLPDGSTGSTGLNSRLARLLTGQMLDSALDFIFPPRCIECRRVGSLLCDECQCKIKVPVPVKDDGPLTERRATAEYGGAIQKAIHGFKYSNQQRFAVPLSNRLIVHFKQAQADGWQPDMILAVPLHPERQRDRGYNQSLLLADRLARGVGIPLAANVVQRIRDTRPQVGLGMRDRQANMTGAFHADPQLATGHKIVIVDDVYTTGATLRACANALLDAGANEVRALTVAAAATSKGDDSVDSR